MPVEQPQPCSTSDSFTTPYNAASISPLQQVCLDAQVEQPPNRFLSEKDERAHFALWAILKSPLMIAADLRRSGVTVL